MKLYQGPKPAFDPSFPLIDEHPPLSEVLRALTTCSPIWPTKDSLLPFARQSLGIGPGQEESWYRSAWWGLYARQLLSHYWARDRLDEVLSLIEPVDWTPLDAAIESGKGVILASAHIGPVFTPALALQHSRFPFLGLSGSPQVVAAFPSTMLPVYSRDASKLSTVRALMHLRRNGVLLAAPDGHMGGKAIIASFLNQRVRLCVGVGELARLSGALTCWFSATWAAPDRIRVIIEPIPAPAEEGDQWLFQWLGAYLSRMGHQMKNKPADLGFKYGVWRTEMGGLRWFHPAPEISRPYAHSIGGVSHA